MGVSKVPGQTAKEPIMLTCRCEDKSENETFHSDASTWTVSSSYLTELNIDSNANHNLW